MESLMDKLAKHVDVPNHPRVKLVGTDNNAYALLGKCRDAAKKAKWTKEQINAVIDEATSGDYNHLLYTLTKYFDVR